MHRQNDNLNETASGFIDDYSHLRLSYYQPRGRNNSLSFNQSNTQDISSEPTFQDNSELNHKGTTRLQDYDISHTSTTRITDQYNSSICTPGLNEDNTLFGITGSTDQVTSSTRLFSQGDSNFNTPTARNPDNSRLFWTPGSSQNTTSDSHTARTYQDHSKLNTCANTIPNAYISEPTNQDIEIAKKQRLREYYISQIPDLPHPSVVMASIISAQSRKIGGNFVYNDRIEQGKGNVEHSEFSPKKRSTMLPRQFQRRGHY